jgi:hypothetical protein
VKKSESTSGESVSTCLKGDIWKVSHQCLVMLTSLRFVDLLETGDGEHVKLGTSVSHPLDDLPPSWYLVWPEELPAHVQPVHLTASASHSGEMDPPTPQAQYKGNTKETWMRSATVADSL